MSGIHLYHGIPHLSPLQCLGNSKDVAWGVLGCLWSLFCKPFLGKHLTTGGENSMMISCPPSLTQCDPQCDMWAEQDEKAGCSTNCILIGSAFYGMVKMSIWQWDLFLTKIRCKACHDIDQRLRWLNTVFKCLCL